jgi:hypothetical protein
MHEGILLKRSNHKFSQSSKLFVSIDRIATKGRKQSPEAMSMSLQILTNY